MTATLLDQLAAQPLDGLDFCREVYALFEEVRRGDDGAKKLRERQRPEKKLIEELLPICGYVHARYAPGNYMRVTWTGRDGGARDAEVEWHGARVDVMGRPRKTFIEVTVAEHPNEHLVREALNQGVPVFGVSGTVRVKAKRKFPTIISAPVLHTHRSHVDELAGIVLKAIGAKAAKSYPENTALLVDCALNSVYPVEDWELLVHEVSAALPAHSFMEILLLASAGGYSTFLHRRRS